MTQKPLSVSTSALIATLSLALWLMIGHAFAQAVQPSQPVINQSSQFRALTKSDTTVISITRWIYIGDAAACDIAVLGYRDTAAVTFSKVQPGAVLPLQIKKLMSTNTTCTAVIALY